MSTTPDRHFYVHAPHSTVGLTAAGWQPVVQPPSAAPSPETDSRPRLCLLSGCPSHQSDQSLTALADFIEQHYDVACLKMFARSRTDVSGLEQLDGSDGIVVFAQRLAIAGEQLDRLREYFAVPRPTVALIPPGSTFMNWPEWEANVLGVGASCRSHASAGAVIEPAPYADGHSVLRGVSAMRRSGCVASLPETDEHTTALLAARSDRHQEPVAWVRTVGQTRSFFTTLGQPADFQQPVFLRLLANAVLWSMGVLVV